MRYSEPIHNAFRSANSDKDIKLEKWKIRRMMFY